MLSPCYSRRLRGGARGEGVLGWLLNPAGTSVLKHVGGLLIPRGLGQGAASRT